MSQIEMMKRSAQREADAKLKPQQLLKEVETLAAVVQTFRASVSDMVRQSATTKANLLQIAQDSVRQRQRMTRTIILTGALTGLVCTLLTTLTVWFTSPPPKPSGIEGRVLEIMASPDVPQNVKDWLLSNVISPRP